MDQLKEFQLQLRENRPSAWEQIPDIALYMDQVISFMTRQHIGLSKGDGESLTPAMINNYIKSGLLPRAAGKKYSREHIGYLTAICLLKQVLSVEETGKLLQKQMEHQTIENFYEDYEKVLDDQFNDTAAKIDPNAAEEELIRQALTLAVSAYSKILACKEILHSLPASTEEKE